MTQTCKSCHEDPEVCHFVGTDRRECEHPVRLGDVEVSPSSQSPESGADSILSDLAERVDLIAQQQQITAEQQQTMQMQWDDVWAAILKVRAGEGP